jgi:hypothetical protein
MTLKASESDLYGLLCRARTCTRAAKHTGRVDMPQLAVQAPRSSETKLKLLPYYETVASGSRTWLY